MRVACYGTGLHALMSRGRPGASTGLRLRPNRDGHHRRSTSPHLHGTRNALRQWSVTVRCRRAVSTAWGSRRSCSPMARSCPTTTATSPGSVSGRTSPLGDRGGDIVTQVAAECLVALAEDRGQVGGGSGFGPQEEEGPVHHSGVTEGTGVAVDESQEPVLARLARPTQAGFVSGLADLPPPAPVSATAPRAGRPVQRRRSAVRLRPGSCALAGYGEWWPCGHPGQKTCVSTDKYVSVAAPNDLTRSLE
ncbi:hypothetical protein SALBM311S_11233 [Streptomyces alboniger]